MLKNGILIGIILLCTTISANAQDITADFKVGNPTQEEFVLAAKRAFFKHHYEISPVIVGNRVIGTYKKKVVMEIILHDNMVIIRNTAKGNNTNPNTIKKYLRTLRRDLTYELAKYML